MNYSSLSAYLLSALTALAFAFMGYRLGKGMVLWLVGGAILGLSISTICIGLMHAATLPYTPSKFRTMEWVGLIISVVVIGITGAIMGVANRRPIN
jgi:hypothetical protein